MKKQFVFFFSFLFLFLPMSAEAMVSPTKEFYVNDYANVLSQETEQYILNQSSSLASATKAQIVVVTVPNLEGRDLEGYATELFRKFGIGDKKENNGLLILLALEERKVRIEVGYGLEGILPDGKTGRFQDEYMIPYFKEDNFDEGMKNGYKAFFQEVAQEYGYTGAVDAPEAGNQEGSWTFLIPMIVIIVLIFVFSSRGPGPMIFWGGSFGGRSGGSFGGGRSGGGFGGFGGSSGGGGSSRGF